MTLKALRLLRQPRSSAARGKWTRKDSLEAHDVASDHRSNLLRAAAAFFTDYYPRLLLRLIDT